MLPVYPPQISCERHFTPDNWAEITCKWGHGGNIRRCRCDQVASFPAASPSELITAEVAPRRGRGRMVPTISAARPGDGGRVVPSWAAAAEGTIITVMSLRDWCRSELLIF